MPIHIYPVKEFAATIENSKPINLPLTSEMNSADFEVPPTHYRAYGEGKGRLCVNFSEKAQWIDGSPEGNSDRKNLQEFLNASMTGPYFVADFIDYPFTILAISMLDKKDIERFAQVFPDWKYHQDSYNKNRDILSIWRDKDRFLSDPSLYRYALG